MCIAAAFACAAGTPVQAQETARRSYYVRADGSDDNNGRSEETPFKTLEKAV